jgi:transposase
MKTSQIFRAAYKENNKSWDDCQACRLGQKAEAGAIEAVGARAFYLPPCSPDLNPIEQVFSKLKTLLRTAAERTVPKLWRRIRALLRTISDEECLNFFHHAGYAST